MTNLWKRFFSKNKKRKTEHEMFVDFMRVAKEKMTNETDKAMFKYLEEIYNFAIKSEKREEKKKTKVSTWISQDLEIDQARIREEEAVKNSLPHPGEKPI